MVVDVKNVVHCEYYGSVSSIEKTRAITKINGVINLRMFRNPIVDTSKKLIFSENKEPIKYFQKMFIPDDLKAECDDLYSWVDDPDDIEQSTAILSDKGVRYLMGSQLVKLIGYLNEYDLIQFPDDAFFFAIDEISKFKHQIKKCDNWGIEYPSLGRKYQVKEIIHQKSEKEIWGRPGILWPGFDVRIGDCSADNPNGTGYLFATKREFMPRSFCSNESAVDYCIKNNVLVFYIDYLNKAKMRVLSPFTESININLQNPHKFRSSNI